MSAELVPIAVSGLIVGGMYLYLLRERRKLRAGRVNPAD